MPAGKESSGELMELSQIIIKTLVKVMKFEIVNGIRRSSKIIVLFWPFICFI